MLKNAIESANYNPDSRERRHRLGCSYEETNYMIISRLWSLDYGRFSSRWTL